MADTTLEDGSVSNNMERKAESPEIECCRTRKCRWQGMWSDLVSVRNEKESASLGVNISDKVCPKCGCKEVYRLEREGA